MSSALEIVNPVTDRMWNETLLATAGSSIFHTSNWAAVLQESYGYRPLYFTKTESGRFSALIPLMEVNSPLTGKRAVSLPFTDYCEPILDDRQDPQDLQDAIKHRARASRWKYVELRGGASVARDQAPSETFYRHVIDLSRSEKDLFSSFRSNTKRNIKKATSKGLTLECSRSPAALAEFYRLHCQTRQGHGVPPQPYYFFEKIQKHVISKGLGQVISAEHEGRTVAAAVYFHFGRDAIYKYGASEKSYQWLRPNNLVMWEAIRRYAADGYRSLCLGRTELDHAGLRQFKISWGAEERMIEYFKYDLSREAYVKEGSKPKQSYQRVMTRVPIPILRLAGTLLYKHMG